MIMQLHLKWLLAVALSLLQPLCLLAQTSTDTSQCTNLSCCSTDLTPAGVMISHVHTKNEWMISYRYMDMQMKGLLSGATSENKDDVFFTYIMAPERMNMQMHMLMGMYGITDRLTVMAMFNYQLNFMEMSMYSANHVHGGATVPSSTHTMKTNGLGDIKLHALYGVVERNTYQLLVSLGTSIPTGSIHEKGSSDDAMYPNKNYSYNMQLGSGSVELLPAATFLYQKNSLATSASIGYIYRTNYNNIGYKLSNEFNFNSWIAYQWLSFISSSLRIDGNFSGYIQGHDPQQYIFMEPASDPYSYGAEKINVHLGSSFHLKGAFSKHQLGIEYGIPIYQHVYGIQLKQKYALNASWSFRF